jgi:hypothetical protein
MLETCSITKRYSLVINIINKLSQSGRRSKISESCQGIGTPGLFYTFYIFFLPFSSQSFAYVFNTRPYYNIVLFWNIKMKNSKSEKVDWRENVDESVFWKCLHNPWLIFVHAVGVFFIVRYVIRTLYKYNDARRAYTGRVLERSTTPYQTDIVFEYGRRISIVGFGTDYRYGTAVSVVKIRFNWTKRRATVYTAMCVSSLRRVVRVLCSNVSYK